MAIKDSTRDFIDPGTGRFLTKFLPSMIMADKRKMLDDLYGEEGFTAGWSEQKVEQDFYLQYCI